MACFSKGQNLLEGEDDFLTIENWRETPVFLIDSKQKTKKQKKRKN